MNLTWQLAWRFRSSKRQNGFISFISASSTMGIALGCFVLIVLLSVMNGFENELKHRLLSVIPHGELRAVAISGIEDWRSQVEVLGGDPRVVSVEPYTKAIGMLQKGSLMKAVELTGISPDYARQNSLVAMLDPVQWRSFVGDERGVVLGKGVMSHLKIKLGDKLQFLLPQLSEDLALRAPKTLWLTVVGELSVGGELDNHIGLMHMSLAADTLGITNGAQGLRLNFADPFKAPSAMREIGYGFEQHVYMSDWTRTQGHLYQDIQLVRAVVYLALSLVIAVACFNIVSTLVMAVNEKRAEIAMLKTMGARNSLISRVFVLQGLMNGAIGIMTGTVLGVLMASYLTTVASFIEQIFGVQFLSADIYFIDFLPSVLDWHDVYLTVAIALTLCLLATLYPAHKAARIDPARALSY
jgi:lipoprotein-releasing system permease protein